MLKISSIHLKRNNLSIWKMGPIEKHETSKMLFECQKSNTLKSQDRNAKRNRKEQARNANMFISISSVSWVRSCSATVLLSTDEQNPRPPLHLCHVTE